MDTVFYSGKIKRGKTVADVYGKMVKDGNVDELKKCIKNREIALKGQARAKTCHPGQFEDAWYGGGQLDYRFGNAKVIMMDIFESEVTDNA